MSPQGYVGTWTQPVSLSDDWWLRGRLHAVPISHVMHIIFKVRPSLTHVTSSSVISVHVVHPVWFICWMGPCTIVASVASHVRFLTVRISFKSSHILLIVVSGSVWPRSSSFSPRGWKTLSSRWRYRCFGVCLLSSFCHGCAKIIKLVSRVFIPS